MNARSIDTIPKQVYYGGEMSPKEFSIRLQNAEDYAMDKMNVSNFAFFLLAKIAVEILYEWYKLYAERD